MSVAEVAAGLQALSCPLLAGSDPAAAWVEELLLGRGEDRARLLAWCRGLTLEPEGPAATLETWILATGTLGERQAAAFVAGSLPRARQLQVWAVLLPLLAGGSEGGVEAMAPPPYPGLLDQLAEAVCLETQGRAEGLDIMPFHLARELKARKGEAAENVPGLKSVRAFLEEAERKRQELVEKVEGTEGTETEVDMEQMEAAFSRLHREAEAFTVKYEGSLAPWLPASPRPPAPRPVLALAAGSLGRLDGYLATAREVAGTAARLEATRTEAAALEAPAPTHAPANLTSASS